MKETTILLLSSLHGVAWSFKLLFSAWHFLLSWGAMPALRLLSTNLNLAPLILFLSHHCRNKRLKNSVL